MAMYTGLARVARKTGYPVVEVGGWKKRGNGQMKGMRSVMAHHTAGAATGNYPSLNVVTYGHSGLRGLLAQLGIGRDGTIYVMGAGLAYHAGRVSKTAYTNPYSLGIEAENTGTGQTWPEKQLDSYVKLVAELLKEFKKPINACIGHKEAAVPKGRKVDPHFANPSMNMAQFRGHVKRGYYLKPSTSKPAKKPTTSKPKPKPSARKAWPDAAVPVTAKHTTASHNAYVKMLAGVGFKDKKLATAIQKWLRWNGYYKASSGFIIDGQMGRYTVRELQKFLKAKGFYGKGYIIDGKRGPATIRAEIRYINAQAKHYK